MTWQPIETAPKDGTFVVGRDSYLGGRSIPVPYVCRWLDGRWVTTANDVVAVYPTAWPPAADVVEVCPSWWVPFETSGNTFVGCYAVGSDDA